AVRRDSGESGLLTQQGLVGREGGRGDALPTGLGRAAEAARCRELGLGARRGVLDGLVDGRWRRVRSRRWRKKSHGRGPYARCPRDSYYGQWLTLIARNRGGRPGGQCPT